MNQDQRSIKSEIICRVPGRVCLFGDHQDYLGLPIIACTIDRFVELRAHPIKGSILVINKPDIGEVQRINLETRVKNKSSDNYNAAIDVLAAFGCLPDQAYEITITSEVAINAGISSSSAVNIAWIRFLLAAYGADVEVNDGFIADIAYRTEVLYHGAPGGKMDQYSIALGKIIYLETDEGSQYKMFDGNIPGLIVAESGVPKDTSGVLGELKQKALNAVAEVRQRMDGFDLKTATVDNLDEYLRHVEGDLADYLKAAILNHSITQSALRELQSPEWDIKYLADLMNQHHKVLKDLLGLTIPLIDDMVEAALSAGAMGAKIVGSGRGGCIIVLAEQHHQQQVLNALMQAGAKNAYAVNVGSGASTKLNES